MEPDRRRKDALRLLEIFREVTGYGPELWTGGVIGFGRYDYRYQTGNEGTFLATGFAPRKANMVLYIMPGYADFGTILARLGKHRTGRACIYFTRLEAIDEQALRALISAGLENLEQTWPVTPT